MNVGYAKFQKKFDSRTISRELPRGSLAREARVGQRPILMEYGQPLFGLVVT